jgi:hypothetical protein
VSGDFCDVNPRYTYDAGAGALVAGPLGCTVGRFAWVSAPDDSNGNGGVVNNFGSGVPAGYIAREQQGLNTTYLSDGSQFIPAGFPVTLFTGGGFWMHNLGATTALPGQKAYANLSTGKINFAATATPSAGGTSTASTIGANTNGATGTIVGNLFTAVSALSGTLYPGTTLSGSGVASGTKILSQVVPLLSGEAYGGLGRYYVSIAEQSVASTAITGTYGLLTVGGTVVAGFNVGNALTASGSVVAGTTITAGNSVATPALTGVGGAGTYVVDNNTGVTSQAINVAAVNVETNFVARSTGLTTELVKASNQPTP